MSATDERALGSDAAKPGPSQANILAAAKGGGFLAGGSVVELASRFVIAFLLARALGADGYGLYSLAISAAALFTGVSLLGLDDAMVRYVAILSSRKDERGVWGTIQIGLAVSTVSGILMGVALYFLAGPIANGLFDEPRLAPLLEVMAVIVPFLCVSNVLLGCARGFGRMDFAAFAENVVQSVVRMALLAVLFFIGLEPLTAVVVFGIADVAATITLILLLNRHLPLRRVQIREARREFRPVFSFAFPLWLSGLLNQFRRNIEAVMLGALSTVSNVGVLSIVDRVNLVGHTVYRSIIVSVKPVLARLHDREDRPGLAHLYTTTTRWTLSLNLPFFLVIVLYPDALLGIFGKSFTTGADALVVIAFAELVVAGTGICGSVIDMTGHTRAKLVNSVLWISLLLASNALLIPRWGVLGAAVASLIASAAVNLARLIEVRVLEGLLPYRRNFWKPVAAAVAAYAGGLAMLTYLPFDDSIVAVIIQALVVLAIYGGLLLVFGLSPEDRLVIERVARRVGRLRRR